MDTLETERLTIRPIEDRDAAFLVELMNDDGYLHLIGDRGVRTQEDALAYIRSAPIYAYGADGLGFNIAVTRNGERVGICGLVRREELGDVDLGYAMIGRHSRAGFATEAAAATLAHAQRGLGLERVIAITVPENEGSRRVLERIGMQLEKTCRPKDRDRDVCVYAAGPDRRAIQQA